MQSQTLHCLHYKLLTPIEMGSVRLGIRQHAGVRARYLLWHRLRLAKQGSQASNLLNPISLVGAIQRHAKHKTERKCRWLQDERDHSIVPTSHTSMGGQLLTE